MKKVLVYKDTGETVKIGDIVNDREGDCIVTGIEEPRSPNSTGRIYVQCETWTQGFYPSVFNAEWKEQ